VGWFVAYIIAILLFHILFSSFLPTSILSSKYYTLFILAFPFLLPKILLNIRYVLEKKGIIKPHPPKSPPPVGIPNPAKTRRSIFEKAKRILILLAGAILIIGGIRSCTHNHEWVEATCTEPQTCSTCGETEGNPLGHDYQGSTCTSLGACIRCGESGGGYLPHNWLEATCTEPERCSMCGKKHHWYSVSLGHEWEEATCTTPKTCSRCGTTDGEPQHYFGFAWSTVIEATCQETGIEEHTCLTCGYTESQTIPLKEHKSGNWQIVREATPSADGIKKRFCEMCGIEMESTQYKYLDSSGGTSYRGNNFNTHNNEDQQNTSASYVLNTDTMKFHRPSCRDVPKISPSNYATSSQSRDDLISRGYSACGHCSP